MMRKPNVPEELSMWDDPQESPAVRQLLRAGRIDQVDYDLDAGLARHLANLQSGAPLPAWAMAQSTVQKGWSLSLLAWLLPPVISATVVGAWIYFRPAEPSPAQLAAAASAPMALQTTASPPPEPTHSRPAVISAPAVMAPPSVVASAAVSVPEPSPAREAESASDGRSRSPGPARSARHTSVSHRGRMHADRGALGEPTLAPDGSSTVRATSPAAPASVGETKSQPAAAPAQAPSPPPEPVQAREAQGKEPEPAALAAEQERRAEPQPQPRGTGVSDARLEREMQMLAVAQRILTSDPERSLRLTRQGEQEFHGSMFSAERTQVSLLALVQLGRLDEARRLGAPFLRSYPNAPWSARLREALATGHLPPAH